MRRPTSLRVLALLLALAAAPATAGRLKNFNEPSKMSEEEIAELKERSKGNPNLNKYGKQISEKPKEVPYLLIGMVVAVFLAAMPFALKAYQATARELTNNDEPRRGREPRSVPRRRARAEPNVEEYED